MTGFLWFIKQRKKSSFFMFSDPFFTILSSIFQKQSKRFLITYCNSGPYQSAIRITNLSTITTWRSFLDSSEIVECRFLESGKDVNISFLLYHSDNSKPWTKCVTKLFLKIVNKLTVVVFYLQYWEVLIGSRSRLI